MAKRRKRKAPEPRVPAWRRLSFVMLGVLLLFAVLTFGLCVAVAQPWPWVVGSGGLAVLLVGAQAWVGRRDASYWRAQLRVVPPFHLVAAVALAASGSAHLLPSLLEARDRNLRGGEASANPGWELLGMLVSSTSACLVCAALWLWALRRALGDAGSRSTRARGTEIR
jgi:hypothetical protein